MAILFSKLLANEAEYIATTTGVCKEALWLTRLVGGLGVKIEMPMLHYDSWSAIMLEKSPMFCANKNHICVKYHFICD